MKVAYDISIHVYNWLIRIAALSGNKKAKLIQKGRNETFSKIAAFKKTTSNAVALFHCASLGEFEQARPVIEAFKKNYPAYKIAVSFFSPSGYEIRKNYSEADLVVYLPADTKKSAQTFIHELAPDMVFIVKYEFWLNLLDAIEAKNISLFLISGRFRENLLFFKKGGHFMRQRLKAFTHFFLQDNASGELLTSINFTNWSVSGDTRFDRVQQTASKTIQIPEVEAFKAQSPLLVIGSGWDKDMDVLIPFMNAFEKELKIIYAPHEIHDAEIKKIEAKVQKKSIRFSKLKEQAHTAADVLIIDNIGMLSSIYAYADYAYVGGAFGSGLHNILEPAVFGPAVFFGPHHKKFPEAYWLISLGYGFSISTTEEFTKHFEMIYTSEELRHSIKKGLQSTMLQACGATDHIMHTLSVLADKQAVSAASPPASI
jgi:3-deoxy-D-manno-octulosonic-acid transferase